MPGAWIQNFHHAVSGTRGRAALITPELETRPYPFIGRIVRDLRCDLVAINGMPDHVHLLIRYRGDLFRSDLLRHVKRPSSMWIHDTFPELRAFAWQNGYGGFTLSTSALPAVAAYIAGQTEHHKSQDFMEEFLELLRLHGVDSGRREVFRRESVRPPGGVRSTANPYQGLQVPGKTRAPCRAAPHAAVRTGRSARTTSADTTSAGKTRESPAA